MDLLLCEDQLRRRIALVSIRVDLHWAGAELLDLGLDLQVDLLVWAGGSCNDSLGRSAIRIAALNALGNVRARLKVVVLNLRFRRRLNLLLLGDAVTKRL